MNIYLQLLLLCMVAWQSQSTQNIAIKLNLNIEENLMQPIKYLLGQQYTNTQISSVKIQSQSSPKSPYTSQKICNIIRAPNHKPFTLLKKLNHKIQNKSEWQKIVTEQSVIYKLQDLDKLEFALDMAVIGNDTVVVVFDDGEGIFYQVGQNGNEGNGGSGGMGVGVGVGMREIGRQFLCGDGRDGGYLGFGRVVVGGEFGVFVSGECIVKIYADMRVETLAGFDKIPFVYNAALVPDNKNTNIYLALGQHGLLHYQLRQGSSQLQKVRNITITLNNTKLLIVDLIQISELVDHALGQQVFLLLDPNVGIVQIVLPKQGQLQQIQATPTAISTPNCRHLHLHSQKIHTSCPQILIYNPKTNTTDINVILPQLPTQLLSTDKNLLIMCHNSFQTYDSCSGVVQEGSLEGDSFHRTVAVGGNYVSVDDLSVFLWRIRPMEYFLACKGDGKFEGQNTITMNIHSRCKDTTKCCTDTLQLTLQITDSSKGAHIFQILLVTTISLTSLIIASILLIKKRNLNKQYSQLIEQDDGRQKLDISVVEQGSKNQHIVQTEESIVNHQAVGIQLEIKQQK